MKKLTKEEKEKIKLSCKIFEAQEIDIDGVKYNPPRRSEIKENK